MCVDGWMGLLFMFNPDHKRTKIKLGAPLKKENDKPWRSSCSTEELIHQSVISAVLSVAAL